MAAAARTRARPLVKSELQQLCHILKIEVVAFSSSFSRPVLLRFSSRVYFPFLSPPFKVDRPLVTNYLDGIRKYIIQSSPALPLAQLTYEPHPDEARLVAKVSVRAGGPEGPEDPDDPDEPTRGPTNPDFDDDLADDDEDDYEDDYNKDKAARTIQRLWRRRQRRIRPPSNLNPFRHSPFFWNMYDIKAWIHRVLAARTIQRAWRNHKDFASELLLDMARAKADEIGSKDPLMAKIIPVSFYRF
jgi:hypothetical protein